MDCFGTYFTDAQSCDNVRVPSATEWTASMHTLHERCDIVHIQIATAWTGSVHTLPWQSKTKQRVVFGIIHVEDSLLPMGTVWSLDFQGLHMPKAVITFVFKVLYGHGLLRYILYTCPICDNIRIQSATEWTASVHTLHMPKAVRFGTYFTHAQSCDNVRVPSATEWTASVHTLHMPKAVITFVFKVLRNGLLRYILYTCPKL